MVDVARANRVFRELENRAADDFRREGIRGEPVIFRTVELRYLGQNFELEVPVRSGELDLAAINESVSQFHLEHERLYGDSIRDEECEFLNFNISARLAAAEVRLPKIEKGSEALSRGAFRMSTLERKNGRSAFRFMIAERLALAQR